MVVREPAIVALTDDAKTAVNAANVSSHVRGRTSLHACGARRDRGCVRDQVGKVLQQAMARSHRHRGATVSGLIQTGERVTVNGLEQVGRAVAGISRFEDGVLA